MTKQMYSKIENMIKDLLPSLSKSLIYYNDDDSYVLFEEYIIRKIGDQVLLIRKRDEKEFVFNHIRHATAWAILDKNNKFSEAKRLIDLDIVLESVEFDKQIHIKLRNKGDMNNYLLNTAKLQNDILRQRNFRSEIDKYITMANICQQRGFENELTRTSRK